MTTQGNRFTPPTGIKAVAFDFNGTTLRDTDAYVAVNVELGRLLGLQKLTAERYRELAGTPGRDWTHPFRVVAFEEGNHAVLAMVREPVDGYPPMDQTMEGKYQEIYERRMDDQKAAWDRNPESILAPGALKTVSDLKRSGVKVAFISTQYSKQIQPLFDKSGMSALVSPQEVHGGVGNKGVAMQEIINAEGILPSELLYVGDERKDAANARQVGAQFAHVASGINTPEQIKADAQRAGADVYLLDGMNNTLELVNSINRSAASGLPMTSVEFSSQSLSQSPGQAN